jgi:nucleotide-binding universal stress UspA family protein
MNVKFCKILALIDYSEASLHATEEAALIASRFDSELQLLHISSHQKSSAFVRSGMPFFDVAEPKEDEYYLRIEKLEKIRTGLEKRYKISISCFESRGEFIDIVGRHVKEFSVDLIVIGAKKRNWLKEFFSESKARSVIRAIGCEVLCVHSQSKTETLKKIVMPVGNSVPRKKIEIAYELAKKFAARIYLIGLYRSEKKSTDQNRKTLIASYRYLKDLTNIPIECSIVNGKSVADAAMHYAEIVGADLILIDEGSESDVKESLWSRNIVNLSSIPVLSVQSINEKLKNKYRA